MLKRIVTIMLGAVMLCAVALKIPTALADSTAAPPVLTPPAGAGVDQRLAANGYVTLPGGAILQWGTYTYYDSVASQRIWFPKSFPNTVFSISIAGPQSAGYGYPKDIMSKDRSSFTIRAGGGGIYGSPMYWMAIGY